MFFMLELSHNVQLHPRFLGPSVKQTLLSRLYDEVEGSCSGRHGFTIAVTRVVQIGEGKVREGVGYVVFPIKYQAVVFRPFQHEVLDGVVVRVNKARWRVSLFILNTQFGFFCTVGPLEVFVAKEQIPPDMEFDHEAAQPCFSNKEQQGSEIIAGVDVRVKIIGTRMGVSDIVCIGSLNSDFLGKA